MLRLPLRELELARRDPNEYRSLLRNRLQGKQEFFPISYFNTLRNAIREFHKTDENATAAHSYLESSLEKFKSQKRSLEIVNQLSWYIDEYYNLGWIAVETFHNITIPMESPFEHVRCSGEISRLDIVPSGGYAVWMFRSKDPDGWKSELRMPLIQDAVANMYGVTSSEVKIGIISMKEGFTNFHVFSFEEISAAYSDLGTLAEMLFTANLA